MPVLLAAAATAAGAYSAVQFGARFVPHIGLHDVVLLALAFVLGTAAYGAIVLLFRRRLPLGRFAG
jgi:hypothetical protein